MSATSAIGEVCLHGAVFIYLKYFTTSNSGENCGHVKE